MKLKAVYRIKGVKVLSGKGVGTKWAEPGDVFTPVSPESGEVLLKNGDAVKAEDSLPNTELDSRGPDVALVQEDKQPNIADVASPAQSKAGPAKGKDKSKGASAKAENAPTVDDLGLGDGSTDE